MLESSLWRRMGDYENENANLLRVAVCHALSLAQSIRSFGRRQAKSWGGWIVICVVMVVGVRALNKRRAITELPGNTEHRT